MPEKRAMEVTTEVGYSQGDVNMKNECDQTNLAADRHLSQHNDFGSEGTDAKCKQRDSVTAGVDALTTQNIENEYVQDGSDSPETDKKKRKRRRKHKGGKHHRRWKPYNKLSWSERRVLDERETVRANQKREEAFAHGHPVAPYNTTQFLMEDHIQCEQSPYLNVDDAPIQRHNSKDSKDGSGSTDSSEESEDCSVEDENFMAKEFSETYNSLHAERLSAMSKDELVKDYLALETKLERLEKRKAKRDSSEGSTSSGGEGENLSAVLRKYQEENRKLRKENENLGKQCAEKKE